MRSQDVELFFIVSLRDGTGTDTLAAAALRKELIDGTWMGMETSSGTSMKEGASDEVRCNGRVTYTGELVVMETVDVVPLVTFCDLDD
mmetsp:Transcript_19863/g.19974  ORF Transcript_19863/g.19974 Transcript_19863/m.19974 type:complete len:88 (-) Transcript_19863:2429-2692(-)